MNDSGPPRTLSVTAEPSVHCIVAIHRVLEDRMPVAINFSRSFYDRFGHDAVGELVNYLNRIDAGYRTELKELNEANFARFDDKLERRVAELKAELRTEIATGFAATEARFEQVRLEIAAARSDMIKWMFVFVTTAVLVILGFG